MGFCPGCGKRTKQGFCPDCEPPKEIKVRDINIKVCVSCGKYFFKNKWVSGELQAAIEKIAHNAVKEMPNSVIKAILPEHKMGPCVKINFDIEIDGMLVVPGEVNYTYCGRCSKKQGKYFEGTLQLRKIDEFVLDFIESYIKKKGIFISKKTETKEGYDLDISDQRKLQNLGHQLKKNFGGILKISIRQFTQNRLTSKQIYRVNVYFEAPDYKKGDVVKEGKNIYLITSVSEKISGINLKNDKKGYIDLKNREYSVLKPVKTTVSKIYPAIEVMDPETYQSIPIQNKKGVKISEEVRIVNDNGLFYII